MIYMTVCLVMAQAHYQKPQRAGHVSTARITSATAPVCHSASCEQQRHQKYSLSVEDQVCFCSGLHCLLGRCTSRSPMELLAGICWGALTVSQVEQQGQQSSTAKPCSWTPCCGLPLQSCVCLVRVDNCGCNSQLAAWPHDRLGPCTKASCPLA